MDKNMQVDGFYYDPVKKRHFPISKENKYHPHQKLTPLTGCSVSGLQQSTWKKPEAHLMSSPPLTSPSGPIKNICSELTRINMFNQNGLNVQECLLSGRFAELKWETAKQLKVNDYRGVQIKKANCDYLIGEPSNDSLYGVWSSNDGNGSVIQRINVINKDNINCYTINAFPDGTKVEDLCMVQIMDSPCSALMCLTNHLRPNARTYSSLNIHYLQNEGTVADRRQAEDCSLNYELCEPSFSCCPYTIETLAIGSSGHIRLFTPLHIAIGRPSNDHTQLDLKGKATSLKFSQDGKRLYAGTNYGHLVSFDVKSKKQIDDCNLQTKSITYLHPLKNENQLIVSCHDSKLFLVDNRNSRTPIISFANHVNDCKKIPVSVDESVDVLCSAGQDYKVRLWSLRSGKLLHEIQPPEDQFNNPSIDKPTMIHSWYSQSWKSLKGEPLPMIFTCIRDKMKVYRQPND